MKIHFPGGKVAFLTEIVKRAFFGAVFVAVCLVFSTAKVPAALDVEGDTRCGIVVVTLRAAGTGNILLSLCLIPCSFLVETLAELHPGAKGMGGHTKLWLLFWLGQHHPHVIPLTQPAV